MAWVDATYHYATLSVRPGRRAVRLECRVAGTQNPLRASLLRRGHNERELPSRKPAKTPKAVTWGVFAACPATTTKRGCSMKNINKFAFLAILLTTRGVSAQTCPFSNEFEVTLLPGIEGDFGIAETEGTDINESGEAVGSAFAEQPALAWRAVRWVPGATEPQILTDGMGRANGIAENAQWPRAKTPSCGGSVWDAANVQTPLPALPGHLGAVAADVNSNGVVVGWSATATRSLSGRLAGGCQRRGDRPHGRRARRVRRTDAQGQPARRRASARCRSSCHRSSAQSCGAPRPARSGCCRA